MGWAYTNNTNAPAANYPLTPVPNSPSFLDYYRQSANSFVPANYAQANSYAQPNSYSMPNAGGIGGNQDQLMKMITTIVQQILTSMMQGGLLGNFGANGMGQQNGQPAGGGGYNQPYNFSPNGAGYPNSSGNGYGYGYPNATGYAYPNSYGGSNLEGGMRNFTRATPAPDSRTINSSGWWGKGPKDSEHGECFRHAKCTHDEPKPVEEDCEGKQTPPATETPPKGHKPPPKNDNPPPATPDKPYGKVPPDAPSVPNKPDKPGTPVHGEITGDPHFTGADGEKYDVHGKKGGGTYSLIADKDVSVNANLTKYGKKGDQQIMSALGFNFANDKLTMNLKDGKTILNYNGKDIATDKDWDSKNGYTWDAKKQQLNVKKTVDKETWDLSADVKKGQHGQYLNLHINDGSTVNKNDTKTTGLWGDSISGKKEDVNNAGGAGVITDANGKTLKKETDKTSDAYKAALKSYEVDGLTGKSTKK